MPKNRAISDRFWYDSYISELESTQKLLFLYLLTNQFITLTGIYEIPIRNISFDTGIPIADVTKYMEKFDRDTKIHYVSGHIIIRNWSKYTSYNVGPVRTYAYNQIKNLPTPIWEKHRDIIDNLLSLTNPKSTPTHSPTHSPITKPNIPQGETYTDTKCTPTKQADIPLPIGQPESTSTSTSTTTTSSIPPTPRYVRDGNRVVDTWEGREDGKDLSQLPGGGKGGDGKDLPKKENGEIDWENVKLPPVPTKIVKGEVYEQCAEGVWLTSKQQRELSQNFGNWALLEIPDAVSEYIQEQGMTLKDGYKMCVKFCENRMKKEKK